jgi:hypothetical protein
MKKFFTECLISICFILGTILITTCAAFTYWAGGFFCYFIGWVLLEYLSYGGKRL